MKIPFLYFFQFDGVIVSYYITLNNLLLFSAVILSYNTCACGYLVKSEWVFLDP